MSKIKKGQKMKLTKIAAAVLSTSLVFGCGSDLEFQEPNVDSGGTGGETDNGDNTGGETGGETTANLFASITDTSDSTAGNLRYTLADDGQEDLVAGALSVDVLYPAGQDQDFSIGLYDESGNTSAMVADIILKSDGRVQTRVAGSGTTLSGVTHTPGTETNFTVTWDAANTTYTAMMDGVEIFTGEFNNTAAVAVASFGVKLGSNSKIAAEASTIDNIKIYSDTEMSTLIFEDDFESFTINDDLAGGAAVFYSGVEAVIGGVESSEETDTETDTGDNASQFAIIADTLDSDTGELRYQLSDALAVGQANVSFLYPAGETETAAFTVFSTGGTSTSSSEHIADLQLDSGTISLRNQGDISTFTPGEWVDLQINWSTNGTESAEVTITVDGTVIGTYTNAYSADGNEDTGAQDIQIRYAGGSATTEFVLNVDDLAIYSDEGTTEVFSDDFESYEIGAVLDEIDGTVYHSNSSEATVGGTEATETEVEEETGTDSTQVAAIADTLDSDTGELRYQLSDALAVGQVNMSFLYNESETETAALTVFSNGGTSTSRGEHIADLQLDSGTISLRNVGEISTFTPGEWVDLQINWSTDGSETADVTVTIDGVEVHSYNTPYSAGDNVDTGAKNIQVRYAGGSATTEFTLYADDLTIYSDAGTTEVFSDDFESYEIGAVLDEIDGAVYHANSSEATVAAQPTIAQ
ncbi:hypothetical protein [Psychromonas sp. L1A2]|uniref:hypothetical protein n=1 Tax=Psychromonas sp. L1A2 TaxID=2686356 RepID=UPI001357C84B|nr:hypothetical protein [Psychromonas sp. L1A2]